MESSVDKERMLDMDLENSIKIVKNVAKAVVAVIEIFEQEKFSMAIIQYLSNMNVIDEEIFNCFN